MSSKKDKEWLYEKKAMMNRFISVMEYRTPIRDVPDGYATVGYSTESAIYIKKDSIYTKGLDQHKARAFRFGVFAREMGRQKFTNFNYMNKICEDLEAWEIPVFKTIVTIVEDPAIENMMSSVIGGYLFKSMKYAIKRMYDVSGRIEKEETAIQQVLAAMIQFGNMGPIKGHFSFPEAKKAFFNVITDMEEAISCGDSEKRIDIALNITNYLRPLWEEMAKECGFEDPSAEGLSGLAGFMAALGGMLSGGSGMGEELDPEEIADSVDLSKGAKRKTTFKKLEDLEEEEREKYESEKEKEEDEKLSSKEDDSTTYADKEGNDEDTVVYSDEEIDLSTPGDYDPEEYEMEVDGMDFLDRLVETEVEIDSATSGASREEEIPDFKEIDRKYGTREYKCKNIFMTLSNKEASEAFYNKVVKKNLAKINNIDKKLKILFADEAEESEYRSSGKLSLEKTVTTTVTPKIFKKSVDPKDKSNLAVILVIDESGSMCGSRIERAKEAAINFAEIFGKIGIPTYTMGFTADTSGADVVHHHYTSWDNNKNDRYKLTSIAASCNNFDGYSIRYASKLLGLRPETHKLMIVISDGQPACYAYSHGDSGYRDTKDAIREARSSGQVVLGVAIGADEDVLQKMYGTDFIFLTTGDDLFTGIMRKFTDMVKKW